MTMSTSIFNMSSTNSTSPKLNFSHAELSSKYLDPSQLPTKGVPFRQIGNIPFIKHVRICMPASVRKSIDPNDAGDRILKGGGGLFPSLHHVKVTMTLKDILNDENLRRGNYLFLTSPKHRSSNSTTISLDHGKLIIDMPLHIYQRSGLTFPVSKIPNGGRKHDSRSARHRIEIDLRQPSMVKGKKGFDRLMYAAKNVEGLDEPRTWLFCDLSDIPGSDTSSNKKRKREEEDAPVVSSDTEYSLPVMDPKIRSSDGHPLSKFHPIIATTGGTVQTSPQIMIPTFISSPKSFSTLSLQATYQHTNKASIPTILEEDIYDVAEYLSLVFLQSSRITKAEHGKIDPYLCQYTLPETSSSSETTDKSNNTLIGVNRADSVSVDDLNTISYSGLIPSAFVTQLLVDVIRRSRSTKVPPLETGAWFAINVVAHQTDVSGSSEGLTILLQAGEGTKVTETYAAGRDNTMIEERTRSYTTEESEPKDASRREFRFATCFEFVDSSTG